MFYFKHSFLHTLKLTQVFLDQNDLERVAEPVYQILRDLYFNFEGVFPKESVILFSEKIGLILSDAEKETLLLIEQNLRQEDKYIKMCASLEKRYLDSVIQKINDKVQNID